MRLYPGPLASHNPPTPHHLLAQFLLLGKVNPGTANPASVASTEEFIPVLGFELVQILDVMAFIL